MLSNIAKLILAGTSLAPILLVYSLICFRSGFQIDVEFGDWRIAFNFGWLCLLLFLFLMGLAKVMIADFKKRIGESRLNFKSAKPADVFVLGFFLTYIFPLISSKQFSGDIIVAVFVFIFLSFVIIVTHSFQFNPVFGLLGYHFYEVQNQENVTCVLITKRLIKTTASPPRTVHLFDHVYLEK